MTATSKRFEYSCAKCDGTVQKPPCNKEQGTLGSWSCDNCGRGVKVNRSLKKVAQ